MLVVEDRSLWHNIIEFCICNLTSVVKELKNETTGPDTTIPTHILKELAFEIVPLLVLLFQASL